MVTLIQLEEGEQSLYIPGYNGRYRITTFGDILDTHKNRLLVKRVNKIGKNYVHLVSYNERLKTRQSKMFQVDGLVYKTFSYTKMTKRVVLNHKDGNLLNDRFDNLIKLSSPYKKNA